MVAAVFAIMFVLWWILPDVVVKNQVQKIAAGTWTPPGKDPKTGDEIQAGVYANDASKLLSVNQTRAIIAAVLLEGAAFLGCIAYLIERQSVALAIPGSVIAMMVLPF